MDFRHIPKVLRAGFEKQTFRIESTSLKPLLGHAPTIDHQGNRSMQFYSITRMKYDTVVKSNQFAPDWFVTSTEEYFGHYLRSGTKMLKLGKTFTNNILSDTLGPFH